MSFVVLIWKLRPGVSQPLFLDRLKLFSHTNEGTGTLDKTGIWRRGGGKPPTSLRKQYFEPYLRRSTIGASFVRTCVPWRRHLSFYFKTSCLLDPPSLYFPPPPPPPSSEGSYIGADFPREWVRKGRENKNRLSSTTCGEELQKIFKDWQSFKEFIKKYQKDSPILSDLRF